MRYLILFATLTWGALPVQAEELSDVDTEMISQLAESLWKGEILLIEEIPEHSDEKGKTPYRNVHVLVQTQNDGIRSFRASWIDGDWRLDEEEQERLEFGRRLRAKYESDRDE